MGGWGGGRQEEKRNEGKTVKLREEEGEEKEDCNEIKNDTKKRGRKDTVLEALKQMRCDYTHTHTDS